MAGKLAPLVFTLVLFFLVLICTRVKAGQGSESFTPSQEGLTIIAIKRSSVLVLPASPPSNASLRMVTLKLQHHERAVTRQLVLSRAAGVTTPSSGMKDDLPVKNLPASPPWCFQNLQADAGLHFWPILAHVCMCIRGKCTRVGRRAIYADVGTKMNLAGWPGLHLDWA